MPDYGCTNRALQLSDTGPCVRYLQELLREKGGYTGAVDGVMGEGTSQALRGFQQRSGLEPTGKTEPVTWELLMAGGVPSTPPPRPQCRLLRLGSEGPDVALLQEQLVSLGFASGLVVDGIFGLSTQHAVLQWQGSIGLPSNGVIGKRAWQRLGISCQELCQGDRRELTPVLKRGDQGQAVTLLQALLLAAGFDPGCVDGVYGNLTAAAVGAMQKATGLPVTNCADGAVWGGLGIPSTDQPLSLANLAPRLRYGSRGPAVRELQGHLLEMGFDPGEMDGIYGQQVHAAVQQLQAALELPMTGKMGSAEWQAVGIVCHAQDASKIRMDHVLSAGDRGPMVDALQRLLLGICYDPGPVDGCYGPLTETAVMLLQRSEGLPVTGIADELTLNSLT